MNLHAWIERPTTRDRIAFYVVQYDEDGQHGWLLCCDGLWRRYHEFEVLEYGDRTPTAVIDGRSLAEARRSEVGPEGVVCAALEGLSYGVVGAIQDAAREQDCLPAWLRGALA